MKRLIETTGTHPQKWENCVLAWVFNCREKINLPMLMFEELHEGGL